NFLEKVPSPFPKPHPPPSKTFVFIESLFPAFPVGNRKARMISFGLIIEKDVKQTRKLLHALLSNFDEMNSCRLASPPVKSL
ncbi:hypothetical protein, partial [Bilophila wadsworthia]|uniref:hypothetical protein n=1 Tax=Bilophila wadsworthia TaxID=35833 RepID=UPI003260B033